jgi:hypothetical protein
MRAITIGIGTPDSECKCPSPRHRSGGFRASDCALHLPPSRATVILSCSAACLSDSGQTPVRFFLLVARGCPECSLISFAGG